MSDQIEHMEYLNQVARTKYFLEGETSLDQVWERVSREISSFLFSGKIKYNSEKLRKYLSECEVFEALNPAEEDSLRETWKMLMKNGVFVPGGRILFGAGNPHRVTLTNCYVLPSPEDSIEGIIETIKEMALTYRSGGGVGFDISSLRPEGSPVRNAARKSTGAWSFMEVFSVVTNTIGQEGRRGALLLAMSIEHPDSMKFASSKAVLSPSNQKFLKHYAYYDWSPEQLEAMEKILTATQVRAANISLKITDEFMKAYRANTSFPLRWGDKVFDVVNAKEYFRKIAELAWAWAEPGLLFPDTAKRFSTTEYFAPVVNTNPCGEQWLEPYGNCNLGHINIGSKLFFNELGEFSLDTFKKVVRLATLFLHLVIFYNLERHPLEKQKETALRTRRVGLGIMGLADFYIRRKKMYGDEKETHFIGKNLFLCAYEASTDLSEIFEPFPEFDARKHLESEYFKRILNENKSDERIEQLYSRIERSGLANSALLTIAPTGTTSTLAGCSSGIEPVFYFEMERWLESLGKTYKLFHPLYKEYLESGGSPKNLPSYFQTFADIDPVKRIKTQSILQMYIDNSISSTVNLPEKVSVEEVEKILLLAYEMNLKGVTIYRENSRAPVIKKSSRSSQKQASPIIEIPAQKKDCLEGKRYRFKFDGETIYLMVFGENKVPREIFLGSKNMRCSEFAIALNNTLSEILRSLPPELAQRFAERMVNKFKSMKSERTAIVYNEKVESVIGLWALALEWFMKGVDPSQLPRVILQVPQKRQTAQPSDQRRLLNLYGKEINPESLPPDAVVTKCPVCEVFIVTKSRPFVISCDSPCPVCGFSGGCSS